MPGGVFPAYPGFATLKIVNVSPVQLDPQQQPTAYRLDVDVSWDHAQAPRTGLPAFFQVDVYDAQGVALGFPKDDFVVPTRLDLASKSALISRALVLQSGAYKVVVQAAGHLEILESQAWPLNIP